MQTSFQEKHPGKTIDLNSCQFCACGIHGGDSGSLTQKQNVHMRMFKNIRYNYVISFRRFDGLPIGWTSLLPAPAAWESIKYWIHNRDEDQERLGVLTAFDFGAPGRLEYF
jgi:hypothetical protein